MARVNVTIPDALYARGRAAGVNMSRVATEALADALDRLDKIAALDRLLAEMTNESGPPSEQDVAEARAWARRIRSETEAPR